jgi:hypothetical protein
LSCAFFAFHAVEDAPAKWQGGKWYREDTQV